MCLMNKTKLRYVITTNISASNFRVPISYGIKRKYRIMVTSVGLGI